MRNHFKGLNEADIKEVNPLTTLTFFPNQEEGDLTLSAGLLSFVDVDPRSFYLIKSYSIFSNVSREVLASLQSGLSGPEAFPTFNIQIANSAYRLNKLPIPIGDLGTRPLNIRFRATNNVKGQAPKLILTMNQNPKFQISPQFLEWGVSQLRLGVMLEMEYTANQKWIAENWDKGVDYNG